MSTSSPPTHDVDRQKETTSISVPPTNRKKQSKRSRKLTLIPLMFLIYFEVSGGPFGEEPVVQAVGPLYAILGFVLFPFIWSIPEALVTAELATTYPGNGGYVIWADQAFGPFWGHMLGSMKFVSGVINNASFPMLCNDYIKGAFPVLGRGAPRNISIVCFNIILSVLNYLGLNVVGYTAMGIGAVAVTPFIINCIVSIPKIKPRRWFSLGQLVPMSNGHWGYKRDWNLFINTIFWNLNFWDNASTLAGEVKNPQTTYPQALLSTGLFTSIGYLIPLLSIIGALPLEQDKWGNGYLAEAGEKITGKWLGRWIDAGAMASTIGLYEAQLSSTSFQLLGMADLGCLPKFFARRAYRFDTPWVGILLSSIISIGLSFLDFNSIIEAANFLYLLGMLLELAAFVKLRIKYPSLKRPYRVPLGTTGCIILCMVPASFLFLLMWISEREIYQVSGALTLGCVVSYLVTELSKSKGWFEFSERGVSEEEEEASDEVDLESS